MNVFDLDADLINRYEQFARSFTTIRADDLRQQIDAVYDSQKFWPEPLIGLNPQFKAGRSIVRLAADGVVDPALEQVFALGDPSGRLAGSGRHQQHQRQRKRDRLPGARLHSEGKGRAGQEAQEHRAEEIPSGQLGVAAEISPESSAAIGCPGSPDVHQWRSDHPGYLNASAQAHQQGQGHGLHTRREGA